MINLFNLFIMTIKKKPVRVQFVNSHIEPYSVRFDDCGETHENGEPLCYYSDAFVYKRIFEPIELSLF